MNWRDRNKGGKEVGVHRGRKRGNVPGSVGRRVISGIIRDGTRNGGECRVCVGRGKIEAEAP